MTIPTQLILRALLADPSQELLQACGGTTAASALLSRSTIWAALVTA
jgi:hypothetical protein